MPDPMGYLVVRAENGRVIADWDGEVHATPQEASRELAECRDQEPLYGWFVVELHPTEIPSSTTESTGEETK